MAAEADILAPICETRGEQGGNLADQAANVLFNKLQSDVDTHIGLPTVEGENFLGPPSIDEVQCEANYNAPDVSKATEKPNQTVNYDNDVLLASHKLDANEETFSGGIPQNVEESKGSSKEESVESKTMSVLEGEELNVQVKTTEEDIMCNLTRDVFKGECDQHKMTSEQKGIGNERNSEDNKEAEVFKSEKNTSTTLKEDPAESLLEAPENIEASKLGQENNTKCSPEDQSTNRDLHENTGGVTKEKPIDATDKQKEILESFTTVDSSSSKHSISAVPQEVSSDLTDENIIGEVDTQKVLEKSSTVSNEDVQGNSVIKLDSSETKDEENEAQIEDAEPRKAAFCENERSIENMIESQTDKSEDFLHVISVDTTASGLGLEIETRSSIEEQTATTHPQGTRDERTEVGTVNAAETKEETLEVQKEEQGANLSNQATNGSVKELPTEEHWSQPDTHNELPTVEEENFSRTPLIGEVHCEVNNNAADGSKVTEEKLIDEADTQKEVLENFSNEDIEGNAVIKSDGSETKNNENEARIKDEGPGEAALCQNEKSTESAVLELESRIEKSEDSLPVISENIKASDVDQGIETRSSMEKQRVPTDPEGILEEKTDNEAVESAEIKEETLVLQNVPTIVPNDEMEENSAIQVDAPKMENEDHLKKDTEQSSLAEDSPGNIVTDEVEVKRENPSKAEMFEEKNVESALLKEEMQNEKPVVSSHAALGNIKASDLDQHTERPSLAEGSVEDLVVSDNKIDETDTNEEVPLEVQNVTAEIPRERTEENSVALVDCSHEEHLQRDTENSSLTEVPLEETNSEESANIHELKHKGIDQIKAELENEENTECTSVKEEAQEEKPINSMQKAPEDIKESDSIQGTNSSIKEQISTEYLQEISSDKTEREYTYATNKNEESLEGIATNIPYGENEHNSPVEEDDSQMPSLEESTTGKRNDEESKVVHQAELVGENEKNTECTDLVKEDVSIESLQAAAQDIKASALGQDRKTSSLEEQNLTANPQGNMDDTKEDKTSDETGAAEETLEDQQDIAKTAPYDDIEKNLLLQVDQSRGEQNEDLENESENTSSAEALKGVTPKGTWNKEEAQVEKSIDSLQVSTRDIKASASCQETSFIEEKILTADPQDFSSDRIEKKTIDAAYTEKENIEDVAINVPNGDDEDKSPIEVYGSKKPASEEASTGNTNDDESIIPQEPKFADESIVKAGSFGNEKIDGCTLVKEEVSVKSLEVENDIKKTDSSQDGEISHLEERGQIPDPNRIKGDRPEEKTIDVTELKKETPEEKNSTIEISHGRTEENSVTQVNCSQTEHEERLEEDSENSFLKEASAEENIADESKDIHELKNKGIDSVNAEMENEENRESTSMKEKVQQEKPIDSLQTDPEDIKASDSSQDTNISVEERNLTAYPQEISSDKTEKESIDAADRSEERLESIATNPQGIMDDQKEDKIFDVTDIKEETLENKSYATTSYEDIKESTLIQEDCSNLQQNENSEKDGENTSLAEAPTADTTESTLVNEEAQVEDHIESLQVASEDNKAIAPCQESETSSTEEKILTVDLEDISRDKIFEKTEVQDVAKDVPQGDDGDYLLTEEDGSKKPSLEETSTEDAKDHESATTQQTKFVESLIKAHFFEKEKITEGTFVKEDASLESPQLAPEDIEASNSSDGRETNSQEEQILSLNPVGLMDEGKQNKTIDPTDLQKETPKDEMLPNNENENISDIASLESKVPERKNDHTAVEEEKSCDEMKATEELGVIDDVIPTNKTLAETDLRGSTEAEVQVADGEKAELVQQDPETEIDQKGIEERLLTNASQVVIEAEGLSHEEEKINSENCKEVSGSASSVALEEVLSSNVGLKEDTMSNSFQEYNIEIREEAENEETQEQEEELHVSTLGQDSSMEKIEKEIQARAASAKDSDIAPEMKELEEPPLSASDENIIGTSECKENEVVENAIENKEEDDRTKSVLDSKKPTGKEQEEIESRQKEEKLDENVEATESTSVVIANDFIPILPSENSKEDHSTTKSEATQDREELHIAKTALDVNEETKIDDSRSVTELESKANDDALDIIETTATARGSQDVEIMSVKETFALTFQSGRGGEQANIGSLTEKKSDANEVAFETEQKSEYESKNQVLESVAQDQGSETISKIEEKITEEKNLEAPTEIKYGEVVSDGIVEQEETTYEKEIIEGNNSREKIKEKDEEVEDYHRGGCKEEMITESHLEGEVHKEIEIVDIEARGKELDEEGGYLKDTTTSVNIAAHEEKDSNSIAAKNPCANLDGNEDVVGHLAEDPSCKQEVSSTKVSEGHMIKSNENENISEIITLESEVPEKKNDHTVIEEENSCIEKKDTDELGVTDDVIPTNETLAEPFPRESTDAEVQVPDGEKAELVQQNPETETDQKGIEEHLLIRSSQVVSESEMVNDEEEKTKSDNCNEVSGSSSSVALEEDMSNSIQESKREVRKKVENGEAQEQEEELHVSVISQDSSMEKVEKDIQEFVASASDSKITREIQELEEPSLPATIRGKTECEENEVVENALKNEEIESKQEEPLAENVEIAVSTPVAVVDDLIPTFPSKTSKEDRFITESEVTQDREELNAGKTASDVNEETKIDNNRSAADLEYKIEDEAPDIIQTTAAAGEGQDVENTSVGETSTLISEYGRDGYEHADICSLTEERSDSNEVTFETGEQKSECESKTEVLESVSRVQSCETISEREEIISERKNLEAAAEIKSGEVVSEDIFEQEEITYEKEIVEDTILQEKNKEKDEDIEDYHHGFCENEVITESHLEEKVKQEEEITKEKLVEAIKTENETKNVPKISEEADDKAPKVPEQNFLASESVNRSLQEQEKLKSVVTSILDTEEAHGSEITCAKTGTQDSNEENKEKDEDIEDFHRGFCENEVITESHLEEELKQEEEITKEKLVEVIKTENETENVPKISKEAGDKAPKVPEHNFLANESVNRSLQEKEKLKNVVTYILDTEEAHGSEITCVKTGSQDSNEEINSSTAEFDKDRDHPAGADDTDNETIRNEGLLDQDSKAPEIDVAARDPPKGLDENVICEASPTNTVHKIMMQQQEEDSTSKHDILPLPQLQQGKESVKQNQNDEICSSDKVQAKDEENIMLSTRKSEEENKAYTWSKPKGDEDAKTYLEAVKVDDSSLSKGILEVPINNNAQDVPKDSEDSATKNKSSEEGYPNKGKESQIPTVRYEINLTEQASEDTQVTKVQEPKVVVDSQSAIPNATAVESQQVEEINDKCEVMAETKLQDLPEELDVRDCEYKMAEKGDPENLQNVGDINENVPELNKGSIEASNKENPVRADVDENIKSSEGQQLGRTSKNVSDGGESCEEQETINDKNKESRRQIDSISILPGAKHSDFKTEEKDLPVHFAGLNCTDVTGLEVTPLPSTDKHVDLEADRTKSFNLEKPNGDENIPAECSQGEHEVLKPPKVEKEEADCGNEEKTDQETGKPESKETQKPSLSDLLQVSKGETSQMANLSATEKEPNTHREDQQAEKTDEAEHQDAKPDEEKDGEEEANEQKGSELSPEALVMVDMGDADAKVSHKKSHNILSGVGSKVKHSIAKVKKAITGKSSHPKPPSPKKVPACEK